MSTFYFPNIFPGQENVVIIKDSSNPNEVVWREKTPEEKFVERVVKSGGNENAAKLFAGIIKRNVENL